MLKAKDVMTEDVVVLSPSDTLSVAAERFSKNRVSGCPVVDKERRVVGILTESDLLGALETETRGLKILMPPQTSLGIAFVPTVKRREAMEAFEKVASKEVQEVMTRRVYTCSPEDDVETVIGIMAKNRVNRVPVVESGKLVGIVSRGDIIRGIHKG